MPEEKEYLPQSDVWEYNVKVNITGHRWFRVVASSKDEATEKALALCELPKDCKVDDEFPNRPETYRADPPSMAFFYRTHPKFIEGGKDWEFTK